MHFTGNGESFYLKINSLSNNNAMEIRMDDPVLSNTQASVRGGDVIQTSKTKKAVYLINAVHNETDNLLKDRSLLRATNNLDFIGFEIDKDYFDFAKQRLENIFI